MTSIGGLGKNNRERIGSAGIVHTWVAERVMVLEKNVELNAHAMHWYRTFIQTDDWDVAWAALDLTLACADERFYLWQSSVESPGALELDRNRSLSQVTPIGSTRS